MEGTILTHTYTINPKAYFRSFWLRWYWVRLPFVVALYAAFALFVASTSDAATGFAVFLGFLGFTALMIGVRYGFLRRSFVSPMNVRILSDPRTTEFSHQAIHTRTAGGIDSRIPWAYVLRASRRGEFTLLFLAPTYFYAIPDSAFRSNIDRERFRGLIVEKGLFRSKSS